MVLSYNDIEGAKDVKELTHFAKPPCVKDSDTPESYSGCSSKRRKQRKKERYEKLEVGCLTQKKR